MFFDLRDDDSVVVESWGVGPIRGSIVSGTGWGDLIEQITLTTGRMGQGDARLPVWTQEGAIVGLEGGAAEVQAYVDRLLSHNVSPMMTMRISMMMMISMSMSMSMSMMSR